MGSLRLTHPLMTPDFRDVRSAAEPPEARGLRRDEVRLLVSHVDGRIEHLRFNQLTSALRRGDLLVVNTSGTLNASIEGERAFGMRVELHLSTALPGGLWAVEVRQADQDGSKPLGVSMAGEVLQLTAGGRASLLAPYPFAGDLFADSRLWTAALELPLPLLDYLDQYGSPIRYRYVPEPWPSQYYQTVFATDPGSAEMPSAGRPFSHELIDALVNAGISVAPLVLHTGVSSQESHEPPYEERYLVARETADAVNAAHAGGRRVIAVGTTVVRALETVADERGIAHPGSGFTDLIITSQRPLRTVDGLLTGFHEPTASHLSIVRAIAQRAGNPSGDVIDQAYHEAVEHDYLWHEFGDSHLMLPA
jgi:S-adenosylmethionine:tRNA ribosyltransferase-isomerase